MKIDVALLAEFAPAIGTGHVVETFDVAAALRGAGLRPLVVLPAATPASLAARCPAAVETVAGFDAGALREIGARVASAGARLAVTNFREVTAGQVAALDAAALRVVCIDEGEGRALDCAAVVNPTADAGRGAYCSCERGFRLFRGPEYLPLSGEYARHAASRREYSGPIRSVAISLGGVDRTGATLRVVDALSEWPADAVRHVVVGAAFAHRERLATLAPRLSERWRLHADLPGLAELLASADVGITAGGNTLCELACLGTPAIVLHEDPHEAAQARAFAERGFGVWLGSGLDTSAEALRRALDDFQDGAVRRAHGEAGRRLVDGRGAERIARIVSEYVAVDSPLPA